MQFHQLKRRELMTLAGLAAAWPLAVRAQQSVTPVIGYLNFGSPGPLTRTVTSAFQRGLSELGFIEGRNIAIEYRWADGHFERLPELAADLVRRHVDVIAAVGSSSPGLAAKAATSTIPIVFQTGADPVVDGLVASLNRPGGNVTGVSRMTVALDPKRLELLHEAVPRANVVAFLVNQDSPRADFEVEQVQRAAQSLGVTVVTAKFSTESELEGAFAPMARQQVGALLVARDPVLRWLSKIAVMTMHHAIPGMSGQRPYVAAGGLMSYDASLIDSFRQVGVYVVRVLKGEKPADLPVMQPTKFELVINLKTAKALGLEVPPMLLARADEVIE